MSEDTKSEIMLIAVPAGIGLTIGLSIMSFVAFNGPVNAVPADVLPIYQWATSIGAGIIAVATIINGIKNHKRIRQAFKQIDERLGGF